MTQKSKNIFPKSKFGFVLATLYLILAIIIACSERYGGPSSGFISMPGLATIAITFPGAYLISSIIPPLSFDGLGFFNTPYTVKTLVSIGLAITICTILVYCLGAFLGALGKALFGKNPD